MSNLKNSQLRKDTGDLLKSSYLPQKEASAKMAKKGYTYDPQLSSMASKVYVSPDGKPGNILLKFNDNELLLEEDIYNIDSIVIKIGDFGLTIES